MNPFIPEFEGNLELAQIPDDFIVRLRKRVEEGLFVRGSRSRANYAVRAESHDEITFGSGDFLTSYNVGLNEVRVHRAGTTTLRYHVAFWRWTWTAVAQGVILGLMFLVCLVAIPGMRRQIDAYPFGPLMFSTLLVFFCLLWPWLLTAIHRKFAEKALQRILREVLS